MKHLWWVMGAALVALMLAIPVNLYAGTYWRWSHPAYPVRGVIEVERPGGRDDLIGNANYATGYIEVKPGLRAALRECVISHERHHFEGFTHEERKGFATDCGDGTLVLINP